MKQKKIMNLLLLIAWLTGLNGYAQNTCSDTSVTSQGSSFTSNGVNVTLTGGQVYLQNQSVSSLGTCQPSISGNSFYHFNNAGDNIEYTFDKPVTSVEYWLLYSGNQLNNGYGGEDSAEFEVKYNTATFSGSGLRVQVTQDYCAASSVPTIVSGNLVTIPPVAGASNLRNVRVKVTSPLPFTSLKVINPKDRGNVAIPQNFGFGFYGEVCVGSLDVAPDKDGDGIVDAYDLDDDNDGILDTIENNCVVELISNSTLDGPIATSSSAGSVPTDWSAVESTDSVFSSPDFPQALSNFIATPDVVNENSTIAGNKYKVKPYSDNTCVAGYHFASQSLHEGIKQNVSGLTIGKTYTITFYQAVKVDQDGLFDTTHKTGQWIVFGNDSLLGYSDTSTTNISAGDPNVIWEFRTIQFTATTTSMDLKFIPWDPATIKKVRMAIDDISIKTEDCDADGDGIPNYLDLDSDNDGCPDAKEGDADLESTNTAGGTLTDGNGGAVTTNLTTSGIDANGVPTIATASGQGIGQSWDATKNDCIDTDGDGVADWKDLDDDNDGILDFKEQNCVNSLNYEYYGVVPNGNTVENIPTSNPLSTGTVTNFDVNALQQSITPANAQSFSIRYYSYIEIPEGGTYTFYVTSDDGSKLSIGGNQVVINDGNHPAQTESGTVALTEGFYPIEVLFFQDGGFDSLSIEIEGPNMTRQILPFSMLLNCSDKDTDGDNVPDRLDLDSDNDGCPDAKEGSANLESTNTAGGTLTDGNGGTVTTNLTTTGVDTNGVPTVATALGQGIGQSQDSTKNDCLDTDGDGVPDWKDLDDDNDGILDTNECVATSSSELSGTAWSFLPLWQSGSFQSTSTGGTSNPIPSENVTIDIAVEGGVVSCFPYSGYSMSMGHEAYGVGESYGARADSKVTFTFSNPVANVEIDMEGLSYSDLTRYESFKVVSDNANFEVTPASAFVYDASVGTYRANSSSEPMATIKFDGTVESFTIEIINIGNVQAERGQMLKRIKFDNIDCDTDNDGVPNHLDLDSDNDGCPDAQEGGASITSGQLVTSGGTLQGGNGVGPVISPYTGGGGHNESVLKNLCATTSCVNADGLPQFTTVPTGYSNTTGQTGGSAYDANVNNCACYKDAIMAGSASVTNHGITSLERAGADNGNWPMLRRSAYTAIESKTKGFVITRMANPETEISNPVEGMMVFDTDADGGKGCLKLYSDGVWSCFTSQTCDE